MTTERRKLSPIWRDDATGNVKIIDQRLLPHELVLVDLSTVDDAVKAIKEMYVRGAPLIGVTAAYGLYLAARACPAGRVDDGHLREAAEKLNATVKIPYKSVGTAIVGVVRRGKVAYKLDGKIFIKTPVGMLDFPVTIYEKK